MVSLQFVLQYSVSAVCVHKAVSLPPSQHVSTMHCISAVCSCNVCPQCSLCLPCVPTVLSVLTTCSHNVVQPCSTSLQFVPWVQCVLVSCFCSGLPMLWSSTIHIVQCVPTIQSNLTLCPPPPCVVCLECVMRLCPHSAACHWSYFVAVSQHVPTGCLHKSVSTLCP